jgi:hypothetical protein
MMDVPRTLGRCHASNDSTHGLVSVEAPGFQNCLLCSFLFHTPENNIQLSIPRNLYTTKW